MNFTSAVGIGSDLEEVLDSLQFQVVDGLNGKHPDLIAVYLSAFYTNSAVDISNGLRKRLEPGTLIGCSAEGVISSTQEIEKRPAIVLMAASLPGIEINTFNLKPYTPHGQFKVRETFTSLTKLPEDAELIYVLGDPFSVSMEDLLVAFNRFYLKPRIVGGMASGALRPKGNALLLDDQVIDGGLVGIGLKGDLDVDVIVSQGCKPVGEPLTVISTNRGEITNLEGQPPMVWVQELANELDDKDRELMRNGLFLGRVVNYSRADYGRGDFLIRGVIGVDHQSGAIRVSGGIQSGDTVQFHLMDADTAQHDLEMSLAPQGFKSKPKGVFLVSCNGRGTRLYQHLDGDISVVRGSLGDVPIAGFFAAGEIGPVGEHNYLHGNTAVVTVFR